MLSIYAGGNFLVKVGGGGGGGESSGNAGYPIATILEAVVSPSN